MSMPKRDRTNPISSSLSCSLQKLPMASIMTAASRPMSSAYDAMYLRYPSMNPSPSESRSTSSYLLGESEIARSSL